jgi:spore germination protein KB
VIILLQICNSLVLGMPLIAGTNAWLSLVIALPPALLLMLVYGRLIKLFPGKNLFEMLGLTFGRVTAVIISALYALHFMSLTGIVRQNYSQFVHMNVLINTNFNVIVLLLLCACSYLALSGCVNLSKWCKLIALLIFITAFALTAFSISRINPHNILPLIDERAKLAPLGALKLLPMPFGEAVMALVLFKKLDEKANPYKVFITGCTISFLLLLLLFFTTTGILGENMIKNSYFPSIKAANVLHIGSIGTRIEVLVVFVFILAGISKAAAGVIASSSSLAYIYNLPTPHPITLPVALTTAAFSVIAFENMIQMFEFINTFVIYAPFFQTLVPLILWITAEIKQKSAKTKPKPALPPTKS